VSLSAGESVTASSSTETITVVGDNGWVVDTSVGVTGIGALKVGQQASATVSGVSAKLTGAVSSIGVLNTASDSSTPSYDVKIKLDDTDAALLNGASANLDVSITTAKDVLSVPSSAVHVASGDKYTVYVVKNGKLVTTSVEVGAVGSDRTQITSGLAAGDQVELADLSSTTSSDSTSSSSSSRLGGSTSGGFGPSGGSGGAGGPGSGPPGQ
jgi:multidrug efflux pump subunit AcrA (membrane-fusion protein)